MSERYDVVGDIHGMRSTLEGILASLGYVDGPQGWSHAEERQLVFVGDFLDAGPDPLGCLELVEELVVAGMARAVLGNHEVNGVHFMLGHRERSEKNRKQFGATLKQIEADPVRWDRAFAFLERTPTRLQLDGGNLRVVHACWDEPALADLPELINSPELWKETAKGGKHYDAVEVCLKGPECDREGPPVVDKYGTARKRERECWWEGYPEAAPLAVFGHYWFSPEKQGPPALLGEGKNAACVDYSVARGGSLVALRYPEREFVGVACRDV
jgi:calcineurin-like phosphoesterase family protein